MSTCNTFEFARWLVHERGLSVIPIDHPANTMESDPTRIGKVPTIPWKPFQYSLPDDDHLRSWFGNSSAPQNLAIVTGTVSHVVAVDGDSPEALAWMTAHLPMTPMRTQTAKGEHWFYRPGGQSLVRNRVGLNTGTARLALDVRGERGYVISPPSQHVSGTQYMQIGTWPPVSELPVLDASWFPQAEPTHQLHGPSPWNGDRADVLRRAQAYVAKVPPAIQGEGGDSHTFKLVSTLVRGFDLADAEVREVLREWNARCVPPWTDEELEKKLISARKYGSEPFGGKANTQRSEHAHVFPLTDTGNAEAFAPWNGPEWRYDHHRMIWRHWDSPVWTEDGNGLVHRHVKDAMRRRYREAKDIEDADRRDKAVKWARNSESRARLTACLTLAQSEEPIADAGINWDPDPYLLACPNGVVDLRTGALRDGDPADRLTMHTMTRFDPKALCPRFERFLLEIMGGDAEMVAYLQRAMGYSLTGDTSEQCLWMAYGSGSNGKTTLLKVLGTILGSYAYTAPFSTFLQDSRSGTITNDLAALAGRRFVAASEVRERARLDEGRIKALTGDEQITARFLHCEFFTFRPRLKLWLAVNHKPTVRDDSHGMWRRVRLIPFTERFPQNKRLEADLLAEAAGILAWAVRGCLLWQAEGLNPPDRVVSATAEYEHENDPLRDFVADACDIDSRKAVQANALYKHYVTWAEANKLEREMLSSTAFGRAMGERFPRTTTGGRRIYQGVGMRPLFEAR